MGTYLNPDNALFKEAINKSIYVDKSLLIKKLEFLSQKVNKYICVSRPRRFGKSTDASMLVAYYSKGCDSKDIFDSLKISKTHDYLMYLNQNNVIYLNMQDFLSNTHNVGEMIILITRRIISDIKECYEIELFDENSLSMSFEDIYAKTKEKFIFVIDEWDCIFRDKKVDANEQEDYLDFLRNLLKDKPYVKLAYMTGILPVKKYGTHSALNMFDEISMIDPSLMSEFMGFTEKEVEALCVKYDVDFEKMKQWYDGYHLTDTISTFSPRSVVTALTRKNFGNYWTSTETYEALQFYIVMNFDGLKEDIIQLLSDEKISVNVNKFQNDMTTFKSKDDVLTLLIHLGYLGYDQNTKSCYIPNSEVRSVFVDSIEDSSWQETTKALKNSEALLNATWNKDERAVAKYIEEAHLDTSILTYNNENALAYTLSIAYMTARNHYTIVREMPSGKGFADMVFIPRYDKPAMIVELKWNKEAETAINQIHNKHNPKVLEKYKNNLILVGITYDKETKQHNCKIETLGSQ